MGTGMNWWLVEVKCTYFCSSLTVTPMKCNWKQRACGWHAALQELAHPAEMQAPGPQGHHSLLLSWMPVPSGMRCEVSPGSPVHGTP